MSRARLEDWPVHWDRHGVGYWVVEVLPGRGGAGGGVVGAAGLRHETWQGWAVLDLCYRFDTEPGPVRRPELEADDGTRHAVILVTHW